MEAYYGTVTNVMENYDTNYTLKLPSQLTITVFDTRFRDQRYPDISIPYWFSNRAAWPSMNGSNAGYRLMIARKHSDRLHPPDKSPLLRRIMVIVAAGILLYPMVYFIYRRMSAKEYIKGKE
jgi:hypothetical protein